MRELAEIVEELECESELPLGSEERFSGYGVMGLEFRSGHVLGLRRFPRVLDRPGLSICLAPGSGGPLNLLPGPTC